MRALLLAVGLLAAISAVAEEKKASPFACDRAALSPEQRKRHFDELGPALRSLRKGTHELRMVLNSNFPPMLQSISCWPNGWEANACVARSLTSTCEWSARAALCGCA